MASESTDDEIIDVAVVGGGVSGCYSAYRLTREAVGDSGERLSVELFELGDRIGGRLWSVSVGGIDDVPAELGGMYFSDTQQNVYGLIKTELGLDSVPVNLRRDLQFLRTRRLLDADYADPQNVPFNLRPDEMGKSPGELLLWVLEQIIPDLASIWPLTPSAPRAATIRVLRTTQIDDRLLHEWGFWNLLSAKLSNEAYQLLISTLGTTTMFQNWNAYDAVYDIVTNLAGSYHKLTAGYEQLPDKLAERFCDPEAGGRIHHRHHLRRLATDGDIIVLDFSTPDGGRREVRARKVVLAMPQRSIELIDSADLLFDDAQFRSDFQSVVPAAAAKIFLTYDGPWWESVPNGPGHVSPTDLVVSYTDLPMRQCYYIGTSPSTGRALLMASYGDGAAASYWAGYVKNSRWGPTLAPYHAADAALRNQSLAASTPMIDSVTKQLAALHGVSIPDPTDAIFHDWSEDPYGGGWHSWTPFVKSWEVAPRILQPNPAHPVFICGESFSLDQGWVEGAINTAEMMLEHHFGLNPPSWVQPDYSFGP